MFFFRITGFLKYLLFARHAGGHGIHSPFVFNLVSEVFRNKTDAAIVFKIENLRRKCLSSSSAVNVVDLGRGSGKFKRNTRKVSDIAKYSAIPRKYGILLSSLAAEFGKTEILELGTSLGISSMYLAAGAPHARVYTVEGSPGTSEVAREIFREGDFGNISLINASFDDALESLSISGLHPGLVFIDGDHRKEPLLRYFKQLAGMSSDTTAVVIDDIHLSPEMEEAWDEIKQHPKVTVTADIYRMGLVFFRKGVNRSDYVIRY